MNNEDGIPAGGATSNGRGKVGAIYASEGASEAGARTGLEVPLVMVSDLPEDALPDPGKFPLWIRAVIFAAGAGLSWALIYALVYRG